jgi:ketosteroid isomerase-like protein
MKQYLKLTLVMPFFLLLYWACRKSEITPTATTQVATTAEEKAVQGLRADYNAAIVQRDSNKIATYFDDDYTIITSRSFEGKGVDLGRHLFYLEFTTKKDVFYDRIADKIIVYENWNMASETGHWVGSWTETDGKVQLEGTYYAKWHKRNGQWKIRTEVFTPTACKGSAACDKRPF